MSAPNADADAAPATAPQEARPAVADAAAPCPPIDAAKVAPFPVDDSVIATPVPALVDPKATLARFYGRVASLARGTSTDHVRIAMYGDSHLTADAGSGRLRRQLQGRFGDAGHGFVALSQPWAWYSHNDVHHDGTWKAFRQIATSTHKVIDGHYGFANMGSECAVPGCSAWVSTDPQPKAPIGWTASRFELYYLRQPNGGTFDVALDGTVARSLDTRAEAFEAAFERFDAPDARHELKVIIKGRGPVRLFGVTLEREEPSIEVDSLGTGSLNLEQMVNVKSDTRRAQLQRRGYDLVVIQLGTNVFGTPVENKKNAKIIVDELRAALPAVPILFLSPPDELEEQFKHSDPRIVAVSQTMRAVADENDTAFWDYRGAMGGDDGLLTFIKKGAAEHDRIHLKKWGYELLADRMLHALWNGLSTQLTAHPATGCPSAGESRSESDAGSPTDTSASKTRAK